MENLYFFIPLETAWRSSIIPFSSEATFFAMLGFGGYNLWLAMALALVGCTIGHTFNWLVGRVFLYFQKRNKLHISPQGYAKYQRIFIRYLLFLLLLVWAPFLNGTVMLAGFFNLRLRTALVLALTGEAAHYLFYILQG